MSDAASTPLRIVTYNIHRARGMDRRTRPERIAAVLGDIGADVIALQEVIGAGPTGRSHIEEIGAALGMGWVMAPTRQLRGHHYGNAILSRYSISEHTEHDLSYRACEERGMQRADITVGSHRLHVYNVHLGTAILERRHQARRIATIVSDRHVSGPKIVLGDFNEWMKGLTTSLLRLEAKASIWPITSSAAAHIPAFSPFCISTTFTIPGAWKSSKSPSLGLDYRSSPRTIYPWSRTFASAFERNDRHEDLLRPDPPCLSPPWVVARDSRPSAVRGSDPALERPGPGACLRRVRHQP